MKKRRLAALLLLAPLALCAGCGSTAPLTLSANWYSDVAAGKDYINGTNEQLEYDVTFEQTNINAEYKVHYDEGTGTLVTTLRDYFDAETSLTSYLYHTEFSISGHFSYKGSPGKSFVETSVSDVWFLSVRDELRPLKSEKRVHTFVPSDKPAAPYFADEYRYRYTFEYDSTLKTAQYTYFTLEDDEDEVGKQELSKSIKLTGSGTLLDNEQIFFALRGLDMSAAATFRSVDPQTLLTAKIATEKPSAEKDSVDFTRVVMQADNTVLDERQIADKLDTVHVKVAYKTAQPGPTRTLIYLKKTSNDDNLYRNVLWKIENPIALGLGTMTYTLTKATFNTK